MLIPRTRRAILGAAGGFAALIMAASSSFACASLALIEVNPSVVRPGQEVSWKGTFFAKDEPVQIRWNALDGPVLATGVPPSADNGLHGNWRFVEGTMTIPDNLQPGTYLVVATQNPVRGTNTWGIPARTVVHVSDGSPVLGASPDRAVPARPDAFVEEESVSAGTILMVGLGAAGIAMFVVGIALAFAARRPAPEPAAVAGPDRT
ncbi:MAG: hypothetical protein M3203_09140 [Actinomycetota bacterium]|nr:hypothetical protein [Actinomycetota bacterium]